MDPADQQSRASEHLTLTDRLLEWADPVKVLHFLLLPTSRWVICWLVALASAGYAAELAWNSFNNADRADGNNGHAMIDFGGQWLMGRMIVEGQGRHLYDRNYLRPVVQEGYPAGVEAPDAAKSDAEALMEWLTGTDDPAAPSVVASFLPPLAGANVLEESILLANAQQTWTDDRLAHLTAPQIGGALYPPVHALYYAPLSLLKPRIGYRVIQGFLLVLIFFCGWVIQRMTEGRVWWPVASLLLLIFPGFSGCIALGQNGLLTLTIVLVGWWQLMRGREAIAGLCWGLLAFKPVWAATYFLVPLVTGRRRMAVSMALTGIVQIALTLPIVGYQSWLNWFHVGQEGVLEYKRQENWIFLSRDVLGIPRRWLLTYENGIAKDLVWRTAASPTTNGDVLVWSPDTPSTNSGAAEKAWDHPLLAILGWGPWFLILSLTLFVIWRCRSRRKELTGTFPTFVLSSSVLTCYHFMYYDFLLAALPMLLLFNKPARYLQVRCCGRPRWRSKSEPPAGGRVALVAEMRRYYRPAWTDSWPPPMPLLPGGRWPRWVRAPMPPLLLLLIIAIPAYSCIRDPSYRSPPWETFILVLLWMWCGYQLMRTPIRDVSEKSSSLRRFSEASLTEDISTS
jgi:hypothetical protein